MTHPLPDRTSEEHQDGPDGSFRYRSSGRHDTANGTSDNQSGASIPRPRSPLDDSPVLYLSPPENVDGDQTENGLVEPEFRYHQTWLRGKYCHYNGYVERIGGVDGERLRENLAAAVRDLLDWAVRQPRNHSIQDSDIAQNIPEDGESETDSGRNG